MPSCQYGSVDSRRFHRAFVSLAAGLGLLVTGCVGVPVPGIKSGRAVDEQTAHEITPGTSCEDVVLEFGEPDAVLAGGQILAYRFSRIRAMGVFRTRAGESMTLHDHALLVIHLDPDGRVLTAVRQRGKWGLPLEWLEIDQDYNRRWNVRIEILHPGSRSWRIYGVGDVAIVDGGLRFEGFKDGERGNYVETITWSQILAVRSWDSVLAAMFGTPLIAELHFHDGRKMKLFMRTPVGREVAGLLGKSLERHHAAHTTGLAPAVP